MGEGRRPPFATGELVDDYEPLFRYWEAARARGRQDLVERATLSEEDFEFVRRFVRSSMSMTLLELVDALKVRFRERVDPSIASEALGMDAETAVEVLSSLLAGWLVEAAEEFKLLGLRFRYRIPKS
ncbi:MAG: hypothetical protein ACP5FT_01895 [Acidilobus sp.]